MYSLTAEEPCVLAIRLIGASLSEPHIDEFAVEFAYIIYYIYISRTSCRKSLPTLILRVLASSVNSKTIHKLLVLNSARRHRLATARMETTRGLTYPMAGTIGATAWQKGFTCRCHYLCCHSQWKSLITWTDLSNGHIDEGYRIS